MCLKYFFACNGGKKSKTVITDGDLAMREVIENVFSRTVHCLCSWHIERNLNLNIRDPGFQNVFHHSNF